MIGRPWRQAEIWHRSVGHAHGRREIRTVQVVTVAAGITFPHAAQAIRLPHDPIADARAKRK